MSNKRRKISKTSKKSKVVLFRETVMSYFTPKVFKKAADSCTDQIANQIKNNLIGAGWRWQRTVKWEIMSNEERVNHLNSNSSFENFKLEESIMRTMLERLNQTILNKIYQSSYAEVKKKNLSKTTLIEEVLSLYFEKTGNLEKREIELENVASLMEDQEYRFFTLCDHELPIDILQVILSFLEYNKELLFNVGRICKIFYLTILSTWRNVKVTKMNLYQISLLVLRNVRSITLDLKLRNDEFLNSELEYILSKTSSNKLNRIELQGTRLHSYVKILRFFCRKKNRKFLHNVRELHYNRPPCYQGDTIRKKDYDSFCPPWNGVKLSTVFTSLSKIHAPLNFQILEGLPNLADLSIDLTIIHDMYLYCDKSNESLFFRGRKSKRAKNVLSSSELEEKHLGKLGSKKRDSGLDKKKIRSLSITTIHLSDASKGIPEFLSNGFDNVETFTLKFIIDRQFFFLQSSRGVDKDKALDIHSILTPLSSSLQVLRLVDCKSSFLKPRELGEEISLPNLRELHFSNRDRGVSLDPSHFLYFLSFPKLKVMRLGEIKLTQFKNNSSSSSKPTCSFSVFLEKMFKKMFEMKSFSTDLVFNPTSRDDTLGRIGREACVASIDYDCLPRGLGFSFTWILRKREPVYRRSGERESQKIEDFELFDVFLRSLTETIVNARKNHGVRSVLYDGIEFKKDEEKEGSESKSCLEFINDFLEGEHADSGIKPFQLNDAGGIMERMKF